MVISNFHYLSFDTKTGRHDIAEILLKVALKHQKSIKSINPLYCAKLFWKCSQ
jgi:hypothetical protein